MKPFDAEFERCSKWLQDALDHSGNTHELADVKAGVLNGDYQFWPAPDGALVTTIISHPNFSDLHIWLGGGELAQLKDIIPSLENYGRAFGCKRVTECGRVGWERALKKHGFSRIMSACSKELSHE
jgi:hypothetical protein